MSAGDDSLGSRILHELNGVRARLRLPWMDGARPEGASAACAAPNVYVRARTSLSALKLSRDMPNLPRRLLPKPFSVSAEGQTARIRHADCGAPNISCFTCSRFASNATSSGGSRSAACRLPGSSSSTRRKSATPQHQRPARRAPARPRAPAVAFSRSSRSPCRSYAVARRSSALT